MIQTNNISCENLTFNPFCFESSNFSNAKDPDENYFNDLNKNDFNTKYFYQEKVREFINENTLCENLSLIHLNIRSLNSNFEKFRNLIEDCQFAFNIMCLSETWVTDASFKNNSNFHFSNYNAIHLQRTTNLRGGGVLIYIKTNIIYKVRNDLTVSDANGEILTIEIINKKSKNYLISCCYKPPKGDALFFSEHLMKILQSTNKENKNYLITGDFNLNCFDYEKSNIVKDFYDCIFEKGAIPIITKPTRVTTSASTLIDNVLTNQYFNKTLKKGIITTDISDHFAIFASIQTSGNKLLNEKIEIKCRDFKPEWKQNFKNKLLKTNWNFIENSDDPNQKYSSFINVFSTIYNQCFPITSKKMKIKDIERPWFTKGMKKSSRYKQKLYIKYLKNKTIKYETEYKNYKNLFEKIKKKAKQLHYSSLFKKYLNNSKKTWQLIKEITGKGRIKTSNFPKVLKTETGLTYNTDEMAENFNSFFVNIGPKLAQKIPVGKKSYRSYLKPPDKYIPEEELQFEEFENAFKNLQKNKSPGADDLNCNIIIDAYEEIKEPLFKIFKSSLDKGIFPDLLKIAKVTPVFKSGEHSDLGNYRPISVLPVFSKVLERIMYNKVYRHLKENSLLFSRQFGFQKNTSTEHAIIKLVDDITKSFSRGEFTLGIFIDLSKAFDTVNHEILLDKLAYYGIKGKIKEWFKSYLTNRKQYISYENGKKTNLLNILCGVPQGSILGPLLFLLYINDLYNACNDIMLIMFADDTNLFLSDKNIDNLFMKMNNELKSITTWFEANKLSLNEKKTKYSIFHTVSKKKNITNNLPILELNNVEIKRDIVTKFLGILIDENLSWKPQIDHIKNKISKSIGILYNAAYLLKKSLLKQLYYSFIHSYLSYGNIAWCSTNKTKLMPLFRKQKHAIRVISFKNRLTPSKPLFNELNILNLFEINIVQYLCFMFKCKFKTSPPIFHDLYKLRPKNKYTLRYEGTLSTPLCKTKYSQFTMSYRAPNLWNLLILPSKEMNSTESPMVFKNKAKTAVAGLENYQDFF
jgi:hypothetical protein